MRHSGTDSGTFTAFADDRLITSGPLPAVLTAVKHHTDSGKGGTVLIFDDGTGQQVDFDFRGSIDEVLERALPPRPQSGPGRPRLGVVAREVTLLPQHWEWLAEQPGGASTTLRKLVDAARRAALSDRQRLRKLQDRTYRFMSAIAGNLPHFEEAARALFADNITKFQELIAGWPTDIREHLIKLYTHEVTLPLPRRSA